MGIIHQLSASVINQIAAGEVVERPASVVKELLENAIDAGATRIELTVERGGKDLIRVADDGRGMDAEDLVLAFQPHATSKLSVADDLTRIRTLGFRGEALAAIAEVSRVRCQTRQAEASQGLELAIDAGQASEVHQCAASPGTVIEVRNLFHNTPVRRAFLKTDATESSHVIEMFTRIALANPTVQFTYRAGGKTLYDLPPQTGIKDRVATFFGRELAESLLWIENQAHSVHLWGYVGHPSQSRSTNKGQFLFVGGRYVRDRSLGHALSEAYRGLLMVGRFPVGFLFLDIPPEEVDVNVHPTKVEVRFRDAQRIYSQLLSTVRQTFLTSDLHDRLQAPTASAPPEPPPSTRVEEEPTDPSFALRGTPEDRQSVASWFTPTPGGDFRSFPNPGYAGGKPEPAWTATLPPAPSNRNSDNVEFREFVADVTPPAEPSSTLAKLSPTGDPSPTRAIQVHDTYLIAETEEGMVVIDQHALHERILYEELKSRVLSGGVESQRLLVPEAVSVSASEAAELLQRKAELARLGLGIATNEEGDLLVTSFPTMLRHVSADQLVRDLAESFLSSPIAPTSDAVLEEALNMIACKAAVKANQKLTPEEIAALLERRHEATNAHHCPHGRPTSLVFTKTELERQFGRI